LKRFYSKISKEKPVKKDKRGGAEKKARGDCGGKRIMIKI
jgi:hypothetical protein